MTLVLSTAISWADNAADTNDNTIYTLRQGNVTMTIDAAKGGRIISYTLDGEEVISQLQRPNMFGSTFWTSPQKEWNWPPVREHDILPYSVERQGEKLIMTSQLSQRFPMRIRKTFMVNDADQCIDVTYTITNEGSTPRKVAPWEITRVVGEGSIFFDAPVSDITPAGIMAFKEKNGLAWYEIDSSERQRKINADGRGWLAYAHNGLLLVKHFTDIRKSEPAPDEAEIQVYVHNGAAYVELESQGAYTELAPGASTSWTVSWQLKKIIPGSEYWKIKH